MPTDPRLTKLRQIIARKCNLLAFREGESLAPGALLAKSDDEEFVVAVPAPHFEVAPTVSLYVETLEWSCDCGGELDPCAHVAAAIVALTTERAAQPMATLASKQATVAYRFVIEQRKLLLKRFIKLPGGDEREISSLSDAPALLDGATLTADDDDHAIDRQLSIEPFSSMKERSLTALFERMARAREVRIEDEPVRVLPEPAPLEAKVTARERGFALSVHKPDGAIGLYAPGVARMAGELRPFKGATIVGASGERLPIERSFDARDTVELVTKVLPEFEPHVRWKHRAKELPNLKTGVGPSVMFELDHGHRALTVRPWIVYGDPPMARVEAGRLVWVSGDVPQRNEAEEVNLGHKLRDELGLIAGRAVTYEGEDAGRFVKNMRAFDQKTRGATDRIERRKLVPQLTVRDQDVDLSFAVEEQGATSAEKPRRASAEAVLRAYESGLELVALDGGGFAPLPREWLHKHAALVMQLLAARDAESGETSKAAAPAVLELCAALEAPAPPSFAKLRPLIDGLEAIPPAKIPADLHATLRPYQQRGLDWLTFLREASLGAVLADDMGLGKTLQCLASLRTRAERARDESPATMGTLVVCPRSVLHNWVEECQRFRPALSVRIYHGESRELDPAADVLVTTYAILRLDAQELAAHRWDAVVLDEAQNIKNPDSQSARAAFNLKARTRIALSGTPIENRLEELWSLMHFANPGLLGGRGAFDERVARPIQDGSATALQSLRERIKPFVLRRRKSEVLRDLPPRTDVVVHCELDPHERAVYDAVKMASLTSVVKSLREGGDVMAALELLLRMRQASCHPALVPGQRDPGESSKVTALCEALEEAVGAGHKALVFSQWTSLLDLVEPALEQREIGFARLDGSTRDRGAVVKDFQRDDGPPVLIASLKAGGTGLNLTAADHVFLLDPWWNPAAEDQAADRAHRMGQQRPVTVYRLVSKDTVEERILELQQKKRALSQAALDEGTLGAALTREDLLSLLDGQ
jgi:superfamily II DNA or RNA helicase